MASENPILIVDAATADSVGVNPRTCWLVLDAHHSIPFQQIESTGQYEAPPRFRARMKHNGYLDTIDNSRVWNPAPTQYTVSLYDGDLTYTFVAIREDVPPKVWDDGDPTTDPELASYHDRPDLPNYYHNEPGHPKATDTLLPYDDMRSRGFGLPHYALCVKIEDRQGYEARIEYCDVLRRPADNVATTDCVECINDIAAIGQISRITLKHKSDAEARWTLVYVHRRFFPNFASLDWYNASWVTDFPLPNVWLPEKDEHQNGGPAHLYLLDFHGQVAIDRIYVYEGAPNLNGVATNLTIHHLDKPYHAGAIDPEDQFGLPEGWAHSVRYHYDYSEQGGALYSQNDAIGRSFADRPLPVPMLLRTEVTSKDPAEGAAAPESTRHTVYRYADYEPGSINYEFMPLPWLEMVLTDQDVRRIMAAKLPPSGTPPPQPDDIPANIHSFLPDAMTVNDIARGGMWSGGNRGVFESSGLLAIRRFASFLAMPAWYGIQPEPTTGASDHPSQASLFHGAHGKYVVLEIPRLADDSKGGYSVNALSTRDEAGKQRHYRLHRMIHAPEGYLPASGNLIYSDLYLSAFRPMRSITCHPFQWLGYGNQSDSAYCEPARLDQALWVSIVDEFESLDAMLSNAPYESTGLKPGQISRRVVETNPAGYVLRDRRWEYTSDGVVASGSGLGEEFIYQTVEDYFAGTDDALPPAEGRPDLVSVRSDLLLVEWRSVGWSSVSPNPQEPSETVGFTRFTEYEQFGRWGPIGATGPSSLPYSSRVQMTAEGIRMGTSIPYIGTSSNPNPRLYQRQLFRDPNAPSDILCEVAFLTPMDKTLEEHEQPEPDEISVGSAPPPYRVTWFRTERDESQTDLEEWDRRVTSRMTITPPRQVRPGSRWYYPLEREIYDTQGSPKWSVTGQLLNPLPGAISSSDPEESLLFTYYKRSDAGELLYSVVDADPSESVPSHRVPGTDLAIEDFPSDWHRISDTIAVNYATEYGYTPRLGLTDVYFPNGRRWARRVIRVSEDTDGDTIPDRSHAREYIFNDLEGTTTHGEFRAWSPGEVKDYLGEEPRGALSYSARVWFADENRLPVVIALDALNANSQPAFRELTRVEFKPDGNGRMARADLLEADPTGAMLAVGTKERNDLGEVIREREIDGTITRIIRNPLGHHLRTYIGTRDYAWLDAATAGPEDYNMILVERTEYGSGVNNAWLPTVVRRYDNIPSWATDHYGAVAAIDDTESFATVTGYDWRMRPVRVDTFDRGNPATATRLSTTLTFLDHLDRPTLVVFYGASMPTLSGSMDPRNLVNLNKPPVARDFLAITPRPIAISETIYAPDGTAAEQRTYDMSWTYASGGTPPFHATYQYAGRGGQIVYSQRPGQPLQVTRLDGVGRVFETKSILPGSLSEHSTTTDGYVLAKTRYNYDADGNAIDVERWERVIDDTTPNMMLELDHSNAVRSRSVSWYDPQKRLVAASELGTEQNTYTYGAPNYVRNALAGIPIVSVGQLPQGMTVDWNGNTAPGGMVSLYRFDDQGNQTHTMDPAGRVTEFRYTGSGRVAEKIENSLGSQGMSRSTRYGYKYGRLVTMETDRVEGDPETTQTTKVHYTNQLFSGFDPDLDEVLGAEIVDSDFNIVSMNNALVQEIEFPPTAGGGAAGSSNTRIRYRYTFSGQVAERIDSRGVAFRYSYDALGRTTEIKVGWYDGGEGGTFTAGYPSSMTPTFGAPSDRIARVTYEYDGVGGAGNVSKVKAFNEAGQYVTSTAFDHDANGNLLADKQAIGNDVVTNTPKTVYTWEYEPTDALNGVPGHIRPLTVKYPVHPGPGPSGTRSLSFQYGAADSLDDRLGRLTKIQTRLGTSGSWSDLTTFGYVGVGRRASLTYGGGTSTSGGIVTQSYRLGTEDVGLGGLDGFGRVRDLHFKNSVNETLFRAQYTHDILGNRVTSRLTQAPVGLSGPDLRDNTFSQVNTYDELNRLVGTEVGELDWTGGGGGLPQIVDRFRNDAWRLDLLGNWTGEAPATTPPSPTGGRVSSGHLDGYGTPWALPWADAGEDERAFIFGVNDLNQYTSMEIEGDAAPPFQATLAYDAAEHDLRRSLLLPVRRVESRGADQPAGRSGELRSWWGCRRKRKWHGHAHRTLRAPHQALHLRRRGEVGPDAVSIPES
ncbi:MAG: hypothetical protein KF705_02435 [Phycisphaeraceae bacterium]|nr:hypothetical protein [Phycisphaeraceae bacterium]